MKRTSLLDQQMAERRQRILDAARGMIGERGYEGLTMRDLAEASRVTVPTFPLSAAPAAPATPTSTTFFPAHPPSFHTGSEKSSRASSLTGMAHTPWHMLSALIPEPAFSAGSAVGGGVEPVA